MQGILLRQGSKILEDGIYLELSEKTGIQLNELFKKGKDIFEVTNEGIKYTEKVERKEEKNLINIEDISSIKYQTIDFDSIIIPEEITYKTKKKRPARQVSFTSEHLVNKTLVGSTTRQLHLRRDEGDIEIPHETQIYTDKEDEDENNKYFFYIKEELNEKLYEIDYKNIYDNENRIKDLTNINAFLESELVNKIQGTEI